MFFITVDIDLLDKLRDEEAVRDEKYKDSQLEENHKIEKELFQNMTSEEERFMYESLLLSELVPIFLLLSYGFSILSKYLFNYQKQLQEELIQKIKDNPELQKKMEKMINKITKKWERLNKKLNLVLTKGFILLYNLALFLLGIEILVIYFSSAFYLFYVFFYILIQ